MFIWIRLKENTFIDVEDLQILLLSFNQIYKASD